MMQPSSFLASSLIPSTPASVDAINHALPQTQCTKCGYPNCRAYAQAMVEGAPHNQCPPGGTQGVERLANMLGRNIIPLNPLNGVERPRPVAVIDEARCIGCTLCIQACPVDAIVGAAKSMHTVLPDACTGCDLCVAPCPVDCIDMIPVTPPQTGWDAWSAAQATSARARFDARNARLLREQVENDERLHAKALSKLQTLENNDEVDEEAQRKKTIIQAALARVQAKKR